jgi:LmbE family N-acetylglucosaminyl deacetylase
MKDRLLDLLERLHRRLSRPGGRRLRSDWLAQLAAAENPVLALPPAEPILVLAPHPDDESIGCGGTLLRIPDRRRLVSMALLTGGDQGRDDWSADRTLQVRDREMDVCTALLGIDRIESLGGRDQALDNHPELIDRLRALLLRLRPSHVFLPCFTDAHLDHMHANLIFLEAAHGALDDQTALWGYEVWSPAPANVAVDISAVAAAKADAIAAHTSQDSRRGYSRGMLGLNQYHAMRLNWRCDPALTHAEAFLRLPLSDYRRLAAAWFDRAGVRLQSSPPRKD